MNIDFYKVYLSNDDLPFEKSIESLLKGIQDTSKVVSLTFFGSSTDERYDNELNTLRVVVEKAFGTCLPLLTYIIQAPDSPNKLVLEVLYQPVFILSVSFHETVGTRYALMETTNSSILITEGITSEQSGVGMDLQAKEVFDKATLLLQQQSMQPSDIVRQWNYIGHITGASNGTQHYQTFNDARGSFYEESDWSVNGYPAATGIGMSVNRLIVSFIAMCPLNEEVMIQPLDNALQIAAHSYSEKVLVCPTGKEQHATPKFERAKSVINNSFGVCFISGTAAIRGEQSMNSIDITLQTQQTIENIQFLLSDNNLQHNNIIGTVATPSLLRVYIKYQDDMEKVKTAVQKQWPNTPTLYLVADICRDELLVEIEGVAMVTNN